MKGGRYGGRAGGQAASRAICDISFTHTHEQVGDDTTVAALHLLYGIRSPSKVPYWERHGAQPLPTEADAVGSGQRYLSLEELPCRSEPRERPRHGHKPRPLLRIYETLRSR